MERENEEMKVEWQRIEYEYRIELRDMMRNEKESRVRYIIIMKV